MTWYINLDLVCILYLRTFERCLLSFICTVPLAGDKILLLEILFPCALGPLVKHYQRHSGPKTLSTLTHSTPLVQSRSFNKPWNLGQLGFVCQRAINIKNNNIDKNPCYNFDDLTTKRNPTFWGKFKMRNNTGTEKAEQWRTLIRSKYLDNLSHHFHCFSWTWTIASCCFYFSSQIFWVVSDRRSYFVNENCSAIPVLSFWRKNNLLPFSSNNIVRWGLSDQTWLGDSC